LKLRVLRARSWLHVICFKDDSKGDEGWSGRINEMSKKIEAVESQIKSKIGTVESKIDAVENKIKSAVKTEVGAVESKILAQMSKLTSAVEALSQHYRDPVAALVATEVEVLD
jgi:phage-related protein